MLHDYVRLWARPCKIECFFSVNGVPDKMLAYKAALHNKTRVAEEVRSVLQKWEARWSDP